MITYAEADSVLPFANTLVTITLTGEQFTTLLEQQWQRDASGNVPSRAYLQLGLSSNVTYTFDPALPEGSRITSVTVDGEPLDPPASTGSVRTRSWPTAATTSASSTRARTCSDSGLIDSQAWVDYLAANPGLAPDFARQAVQITGLTDVVRTGANLTMTVGGDRTTTPQPIGGSSLDLTSLGAPANTSLSVSIGGVSLGTVPVVNGTATVNLAVPATVPNGVQDLVLTASPSGTTVRVQVTVDPALTGVQPTRLFDTRPGQSPEAIRTVPKAKVGGATELTVRAVEIPGKVPATGVGAVSLNVAVTNPEAAGFVTVYDCVNRQLVASVNYVAGETVSNAVIAPVSSTGNICFYSLAPTDIVVDVNGWLAAGSDYTAVSPYRLFDTRPGESPNALVSVPRGKVGGAAQILVDVTPTVTPGTPSTVVVPPSGVGAVSLNVAVDEPDAAGFVTVYDCTNRQLVASLNYVAGEVASNAVIAPVSPGGNVCFYSLSRTHIVVDINGWFATGGSYVAAGPNRVFDTRGATESPDALVTVPVAKVGAEQRARRRRPVPAGRRDAGQQPRCHLDQHRGDSQRRRGVRDGVRVRRAASVRSQPQLPGRPDHLQRSDRPGRRRRAWSASTPRATSTWWSTSTGTTWARAQCGSASPTDGPEAASARTPPPSRPGVRGAEIHRARSSARR